MPGQKQYSKLPEIIFLNLSKTIEFSRDEINWNKFDTNKDASNICENERIFLNLLKFTWISSQYRVFR